MTRRLLPLLAFVENMENIRSLTVPIFLQYHLRRANGSMNAVHSGRRAACQPRILEAWDVYIRGLSTATACRTFCSVHVEGDIGSVMPRGLDLLSNNFIPRCLRKVSGPTSYQVLPHDADTAALRLARL